jgi:hypothetical protein
VLEDAAQVFSVFDGFDGDGVDAARWQVTGDVRVEDGVALVPAGGALVLSQGFAPPLQATVVARLNGATCDEVFIGFTGDEDALFDVPPSAGLFVDVDLQASARIAPTADSVPTDVGTPGRGANRFARTTVAVDGGAVRIAVDEEVFVDDADVRPPFGAAPLFLAVQVGGSCSVDVDALWLTPLPLPPPEVSAAASTTFDLSFGR